MSRFFFKHSNRRTLSSTARFVGVFAFLLAAPAMGQAAKDFNACTLFTADDAKAVLGATAVEQEAMKGKPTKFSPNCSYAGTAEGKAVNATVKFRFLRSANEATAILKEARLDVRGRPLIISGHDAYWHPKLAELVVAKGPALVTITAGPVAENERLPEVARKAADLLLPKLP